ncbi:hypothetical protein CEXT_22231 [Caerostris extrusa]|uniref:Uncharacterized protein n=1 Tax=Caerostris extrusa TaxID=172846 RepID=A0AAV4YAW3_CAEEX|nr:hypothetical protein CEXT_22231 [Caerostris extrusa]
MPPPGFEPEKTMVSKVKELTNWPSGGDDGMSNDIVTNNYDDIMTNHDIVINNHDNITTNHGIVTNTYDDIKTNHEMAANNYDDIMTNYDIATNTYGFLNSIIKFFKDFLPNKLFEKIN